MYQVDGFIFDSREKARQAKKEEDGVAYIRQQTHLNDPDVVLKLYNKLLDEEIFHTEVGISFLRKLQERLHTIPYIKNEEIRPIPIHEQDDAAIEKERQKARERGRKLHRQELKQSDDTVNYKGRYHVALYLCITFALIIAGIFAITYASGNSKNIFNYKTQIINEYEAWEQELETRENELDAREAELEIREERLQAQQE